MKNPNISAAKSLPSQTVEVYLRHRPRAALTPATFATRISPLPAPHLFKTPHALVKVLFLSCDPAQRIWLNPSRSYMHPVAEGSVMRAVGIGEVIYPAGDFHVGDLVEGMFGWTEFAYMPAAKITRYRAPTALSISAGLGVLGITGSTAYFGLLDVGRLKRGDVVVVSAAAGATGSVAAQIAKNVYKCQTIGIAGGQVKCEYLRNELGIEAVDYKAKEGVEAGLKRVLRKRRIDVYFDNVGGKTLEAALKCINHGARIVVCGAISGYNSESLSPGPYNYLNLITYSASMTGFLLRDYQHRFTEARNQLEKWVSEGKVKAREDVVHGLTNAPMALKRLFDGANTGKVVVRVGSRQTSRATLANL